MFKELLTPLDQRQGLDPSRFAAAAMLAALLLVTGRASGQDNFVELGRTLFGGSEYLLIGLGTTPTAAERMTPFQARDAAGLLGGWLMAVGSEVENNTVASTLAPFRPGNEGNLWIGLTDRSFEEDPIYGVVGASEGNLTNGNVAAGWKWGNGEPVVYTNWNSNGTGGFTEPNDAGATGEDWAEIWNLDSDPNSDNYLSWNDDRDTKLNWAVIERTAVPPPLILEVNAFTGDAYLATTFSAEETVSVTLTDYQLRPNSATFDVAGWQATNLSARLVDAINPNAEGQRWETISNTPNLLIESYLLGGTEFVAGSNRTWLGKLVVGGSDPAAVSTIEMQYAINVDAVNNANDQNNLLRGELPSDPVTVVVIDPDFNNDGLIDAADYTVWRGSEGATGAGLAADANGDEVVDGNDYAIWRANYGAVASPSTATSVPLPFRGIVARRCCRLAGDPHRPSPLRNVT